MDILAFCQLLLTASFLVNLTFSKGRFSPSRAIIEGKTCGLQLHEIVSL